MENRTKHKKKKKKSAKKKILLGTLSVILIAILSIFGYYSYHIYNFTNKIQAKTKPKLVATKEWTGGRVNILLVGGDTRSKGSDNSDSMILLSADPKTHKAQMFSIMRDTLWKIPGHDYHKINSGNLIGGPELAVQTVENFLDIPINFYVETDFQGFKKMVDILGGVDINVDETMNYESFDTHIHLKPGEQHLDGTLALEYARFRHDAMGDFNRTKRQRELLKALAAKTETSYGLIKIPQLLDALGPYVQTNMTTGNMLEIANLLHGINVTDLQTEQVPQMNDILQKTLPGFGAVLIPDVLATRQYVHEQLDMNDTPTATSEEQYYWNLYKNGGPSQDSNTGTTNTTNSAASGTKSSSTSSYHSVTTRSSSSTINTKIPASSGSTTGTTRGTTSSSSTSTNTGKSTGSTSTNTGGTTGSTSTNTGGTTGSTSTNSGGTTGSTPTGTGGATKSGSTTSNTETTTTNSKTGAAGGSNT